VSWIGVSALVFTGFGADGAGPWTLATGVVLLTLLIIGSKPSYSSYRSRPEKFEGYNWGVKLFLVAQLFVCAALAAHKPQPTPTNKTGNAQVELTATLYADKESIEKLLGSDLGGYYVVIDVRLAPKNNEKVKVFRDDFQLRTDRDGEKAKPFAPSQIAGKGALIVSPTSEGGTSSGPTFSGGFGGLGVGSGAGTVSNTSKMDRGSRNKENPLLGMLNEKALAEKETDQPVSGLLFFPMEPKQRIKDLELTYAGPGSKLTLRFR
jgi:hypothetical protein